MDELKCTSTIEFNAYLEVRPETEFDGQGHEKCPRRGPRVHRTLTTGKNSLLIIAAVISYSISQYCALSFIRFSHFVQNIWFM